MKVIFQKISKGLNNQLVKNILLVGGMTFGVKVLSFFKETEVAASFGLSIFLDTFLIAILIPNFIQQVFIGSLNSLFIPNYIIERKTTKQLGAFQSVSLISILGIVAVLSLGFIVFSVFFLETVFPDHDVEYYRLLRNQIYIVLPCILFWGLSSFGNALLEIEDHFFLSKVSMFYPPTITLICLFYFQDFFGDYVLAYSMLLGSIFVFIHLAYIVRLKKLLFISRIQINDNIREMIKQYVPKVTSSLLTGINPFVDQFFAAQLAIGSIAAINYGIKLPSFIISIVMIALGNVLLPHFSKAVTANFEKAYQQLKKIWSVAFLGSAIICIVILFFSEDIIELLFERKEFTGESTLIVSKIQVIFLVHVPFYLCTLITVRFLTALNRNKFMAWVSFLNLILNIILNIIFIKYFEVYGLVLSTTVVYIIASFFYVGYAIRISKNQLA